MAGSEAPALRKLPGTATPIRLPLPRQSPTLPFSATDPEVAEMSRVLGDFLRPDGSGIQDGELDG